MASPKDIERLENNLARTVTRTSKTYGLLEPEDHIMVAISGGKDSYTMLTLLERIRRRAPFPFRLTAVHLDQQQPDYDGVPLVDYVRTTGIPFEILSEDTFSIVTEHTPEGRTFCSICSRLRRGILYTAAERLGCNKIALGHHRDDALETCLMNLIYAGKLQAMPARYQTNDGRFSVIRPLIECAEEEIERYAQARAYPILPCNLCGAQPGGTKRDAMARLLTQLESENPNVRAVMLNALKNVRTTHLLDTRLLNGAAEPSSPETTDNHPTTVRHHRALPVLSGEVY